MLLKKKAAIRYFVRLDFVGEKLSPASSISIISKFSTHSWYRNTNCYFQGQARHINQIRLAVTCVRKVPGSYTGLKVFVVCCLSTRIQTSDDRSPSTLLSSQHAESSY
jgi:hypothetical protein